MHSYKTIDSLPHTWATQLGYAPSSTPCTVNWATPLRVQVCLKNIQLKKKRSTHIFTKTRTCI